MIRNESFYIKKIVDKTYILPVGQMVADHMHGIQINETGELIWDYLKNDISISKLNQKCVGFYEAQGEDAKMIESDVESFVSMLKGNNMILEKGMQIEENEFIQSVSIADIKVGFYGDKDCFPNRFDAFKAKSYEEDLRIEISHKYIPFTHNGNTLIRNAVVNTTECEDRFILEFSECKEIIECHLNKEGTLARFYTVSNMSAFGKEMLYHAIRCVFLYRALKERIIAVHSASINYKDKAWLFSAVSGTGKTTHVSNWNKLYGTNIINGDLNLIGIKNSKAVVYGLPWCGTSETFDTKEYELGGVILLKRNKRNFVEELTADKKVLLVQQRIISPSWNEELIDLQFDVANEIIDRIVIARLNCTAEDESAKVMRDYIDNV